MPARLGVRPALHLNLTSVSAAGHTINASIERTSDAAASVSSAGGTAAASISVRGNINSTLTFKTSTGYYVSSFSNFGIEMPFAADVVSMNGFKYTASYNAAMTMLTIKFFDIKSDINIVARVAGSPYTIRYDSNPPTGSVHMWETSEHEYGAGKALRANTFEYPGYAFQGWATSAGGAVVYSDKQPVSNLTTAFNGVYVLYAKWVSAAANVVTSVSPANSGNIERASVYVLGETAVMTATPMVGYVFDGWYQSDKLVCAEPTYRFAVSSAVTLVAKFRAPQVQVESMPTVGGTVKIGSGTSSTSVQAVSSFGAGQTVSATPASGYTFIGWYDANGRVVSTSLSYTFVVGGETKLIALFSNGSGGGGYGFNINLATGGGTAMMTARAGNKVTCLALPEYGYVFSGWYTAATGGNMLSSEPQAEFTLTENTDIYARFSVSTSEILLSVQTNTGGEARVISGGLKLDEIATVVAVPYAGYTFRGWSKVGSSAIESTAPTYSFTLTEPLVLRAQFVISNVPTSVYNINHAADLVALSNYVNAGNALSGVTVNLYTDIDLANMTYAWQVIGNTGTKFEGIFQGNGHTISNSGISSLNLFAAGTTAKVYNLSLGAQVVAGATIESSGLLPTDPDNDDWATVNPGGR